MTEATWVILGLVGVITAFLLHYAFVTQPRLIAQRRREGLRVFSTAIELRFPGHSGTTRRVLGLAEAVGAELGLSSTQKSNLNLACQLRDIGLCAVPWKLINFHSPMHWSDAEKATYERHAEVGAAMLELVPSLQHLAAIVRYHRANFDGSSGPTFPSKDDLPIEARILGTIDDYVSGERFQGQLLARQHLTDEAGRRYDPAVVAALLRVLPSMSAEARLEDLDLADRAVSSGPRHQAGRDSVGPPE